MAVPECDYTYILFVGWASKGLKHPAGGVHCGDADGGRELSSTYELDVKLTQQYCWVVIKLASISGLADDCLPPGLHWVGIREFRDTFVTNYHRTWLFEGFVKACIELRTAGCARVFVGGSFITSKQFPSDYDACWDPVGASSVGLDPLLYDRTLASEQVKRYRGEWFIGQSGNGPESSMYKFLSHDRNTGIERGMAGIKLQMIELHNL